MMTPYQILSIILILLASCRSAAETDKKSIDRKNEITVTPIFKGSAFLEKHKETGYFFSYDIAVTNNTKSPIEFWTLSAAPIANVIIDPDQMDFFIPPFSHNGPILIKLNPNQQFVFPVIINRAKALHIDSLRFGFIIYKPKYKDKNHKILDTQENPIDALAKMRNDKKDVIWSKKIPLDLAVNELKFQIRTIINDSTFIIIPGDKYYNR